MEFDDDELEILLKLLNIENNSNILLLLESNIQTHNNNENE